MLEAFRQHHLYARLDKCLFASDVVTFCGHVVSYNEVRMESDKVEAVRSWTPPTNVGQLRSFLGFVNYYRKFLRHIGEVAAPLTKLAGRGHSGHQLRLDAQQISAFEHLKALVTDEPILRMFDPTNTSLAIFCDSSDLQAGSFWAQDHGQGWQPGGFESHTLSGAESRYSARDKELLAVVQACKRWRHLIHGRPVVVYSDHQSLSLLLKGGSAAREMPSARVARHVEYLSQFDLAISYIPQKDQVLADALSRLPSASLDKARRTPLAAVGVSLEWDKTQRARWQQAQAADEYFGPVMAKLTAFATADPRSSDRTTLRATRFVLVEGLLYFREGGRLCVPARMGEDRPRLALLKEHHDTPSGGHVGAARCHLSLAKGFFWPLMERDVRNFVRSCRSCQQAKPDLRPSITPLQPLAIPEERWHTVSIDWITGLPKTERGFDAILTVTDLTTDRVRCLQAHATDTAEDTAQLFLEHVYCQHGLPVTIVSDRDPKVISEFWSSLMARLGTRVALTTANHAQADGRSERSNQTVVTHLKQFVDYNQGDWDRHVN